MEIAEESQVEHKAWCPPCSQYQGVPVGLARAWRFSASLSAECRWPGPGKLLRLQPSLGNSVPLGQSRRGSLRTRVGSSVAKGQRQPPEVPSA